MSGSRKIRPKFNYLGQNDKKDVDSVADYRLYTYNVLWRSKAELTGDPYVGDGSGES